MLTIAGNVQFQDHYRNLNEIDLASALDLTQYQTRAGYYRGVVCDFYFYGQKTNKFVSKQEYIRSNARKVI